MFSSYDSWRLNEFTPGFSRSRDSEKWLRSYIREMERARPGDALWFGRYPISTGMKPLDADCFYRNIQWRVLEVRGDRLMLLSEHILDWEGFDFECKPWKQSYLRDKLNGEYMNLWFTPMEQSLLCGEPDKVYLLTVDRARKYFSEPGSAAAHMLQSCACSPEKNDGLSFGVELYPNEWWLCTPGSESGCTAFVTTRGEIDGEGYDSDADEFGVRPVIWIDISKLKELADKED